MKWLLMLALGLALVATPAAARTYKSEPRAYPTDGLSRVRIELSVGEMTIEGSDSDKVRLTLVLHCKRGGGWCEEKADEVEIDARRRGDELVIEIDDAWGAGDWWGDRDGWHVEALLQVPADLALDVEMGVGELEVTDMRGDLDVSLKIGEASVRMPEASVRRVYGSVGIGEATIDSARGVETVSGLIGRKVRWSEGVGRSRVEVSVGIGELSLRLM